MSPRRFLALLVAALATISFAFWLSTQRSLPRDGSFGARALPGLEAAVDDVDRIRVVGAGDAPLVTLVRTDGRWRVAERDYPADPARVRALLRGLGELRVVEPKTRDPARYATLGVEDVAAPAAAGVRVELGGLPAPLALVVGREADVGSTYVRVATEPQALLAAPRLDVPRDPRAWLARTPVDVVPARVHAFAIERPGEPPWGAAKATRDAAHFTVADLPPGQEPYAADAADAIGNALAAFEVEDVGAAGATAPAGATARATYRTFDGLVVVLTGVGSGAERWVRIDASFDPALAAAHPPAAGDVAPDAAAVRAEAERIAATAAGRWYRVSADRYERAFRALDGLLRRRGST